MNLGHLNFVTAMALSVVQIYGTVSEARLIDDKDRWYQREFKLWYCCCACWSSIGTYKLWDSEKAGHFKLTRGIFA